MKTIGKSNAGWSKWAVYVVSAVLMCGLSAFDRSVGGHGMSMGSTIAVAWALTLAFTRPQRCGAKKSV